MSNSTPTIPPLDERFIADLEGQLRRGIERRRRLDPVGTTLGRPARRGPTRLTTATLMLLSLLIGATGTFAVVHQDAAPHRDLHVQKAVIRLERAKARLEQHRAALADATMRYEQGVANVREAATMRRLTDRAESDVRLRELDLSETRRTGRAPVDELAAPLVGGEDFVAQRLIVRQEAAALELEHLRTAERRLEMLVAEGAISSRELVGPRADRAEAERMLAAVQERLALRRAFVEGQIAPVDVELRALQNEAETAHAAAADRLDAARTALEYMAALHASAAVSSSELRAAQGAVRDAEAAMALAEVERQLVREHLGTSPPRK